MNSPFFTSLLAQWHWQLSLLTAAGLVVVMIAVGGLKSLVPAFRESIALNTGTYKEKMQQPHYAANQLWNRKWSILYLFAIVAVIMPFCVTLDAQPWWKVLLDIAVILMVYDFIYYLTHRFLFHDSAFLGGPLKWMHAVHHRQHNPCRADSSYIHPLEVAIGLGLFIGTVFFLSLVMGRFHVGTVVVTWFVFSEINTHNHALWKTDTFPFRYLNYASKMHHTHHARFTGGNYATISLLYDWLFGTLDDGKGYGKNRKA